MMNVTINAEKNGVEIRFNSKPEQSVLDVLRSNGFRWSGKQKMWYTKQSEEAFATIKSIDSSFIAENKSAKPMEYDLWKMTRTDSIGNNYADTKLTDCKEIAAIVRKHIKARFPMCKFSVRSDYNSIDIDLLSSPFERGSDELKAIVHYVYTYVESYDYDNSDYYSDYYDVNFYCGSENGIVSYKYEQTEMTVEYANMVTMFKESKAKFEEEETARKDAELQESIRQMEIEKVEAAKREVIKKEEIAMIEANAKFENIPLIVTGCLEIKEDDESKNENRCVCKVARVIHFDKVTYDMFMKYHVTDFTFLAGMGGYDTDDYRITSMTDYDQMSEEERKTVEWFNVDCVAIYCDGKLVNVIDPEGFSYARYIYVVDDNSEVVSEYIPKQVITIEEHEQNKELAMELEDASSNIISTFGLLEVWKNEKFAEYRTRMKKWIVDNHFTFNVGVVRAITCNEDLKVALYRILNETDSIVEQFRNAELTPGQKVTLIMMSDFGGIVTNRVAYASHNVTNYAQYNNVVKIIFKPERKRDLHSTILNRECFIVDGWFELPENLLWEVSESNGMLCKKSRFLSCDKKQFDVILDWLKHTQKNILVNTYKPVFG